MPIVAIAPIVVALALLLIWYAAQQLHFPAFNAIAHNVPGVGALLLRGFLAAVDWAVAQSEQWVNDSIGALKALILAPVQWLQRHIDLVVNSLYKVGLALDRLIKYSLPSLAAQLVALFNHGLATLQGWASQQFAAVYTWADAQFTAVYRFVDTEIALADNYALQLVTAAENYAAAGIAADAKYAQGLFTDAITYVDGQTTALEKWVTGELGQVTTWAGSEISALSHALTADITQVIAYAGALVVPLETDLARLKADCTDNLCENLSPLANLLKSLGGDLGIAALIALAAEMAHDPKGTAAEVDRILSPVVNGAAGVMRAAAGV